MAGPRFASQPCQPLGSGAGMDVKKTPDTGSRPGQSKSGRVYVCVCGFGGHPCPCRQLNHPACSLSRQSRRNERARPGLSAMTDGRRLLLRQCSEESTRLTAGWEVGDSNGPFGVCAARWGTRVGIAPLPSLSSYKYAVVSTNHGGLPYSRRLSSHLPRLYHTAHSHSATERHLGRRVSAISKQTTHPPNPTFQR